MVPVGVIPPFRVDMSFKVHSEALVGVNRAWAVDRVWRDPSKPFQFTFPRVMRMHQQPSSSLSVHVRELRYRITDARGRVVFSSGKERLELFKRSEKPLLGAVLLGLSPAFLDDGKRSCEAEVHLFPSRP